LTKARELAAEKRVAVSQGVETLPEKQSRKEAAKLAATLAKVGTVKALYDEFFARQIEGQRKEPETGCRGVALHILPRIGNKAVADVRPGRY
jgi:hypothetical protein